VVNSQDDVPSQHPDLLAAVVLHMLVSEGSNGMTIARIAAACDRDPDNLADVVEVKAALEILLDDGLAQCEDALFRPTRAAVRASELSF
jgi:hypothetical protein